MYNLHVTVRETISCVMVTAAVSDTNDLGQVTTLGVTEPRFFERLDENTDDLFECFGALRRWAILECNSVDSTSGQNAQKSVDSTVGGGAVG